MRRFLTASICLVIIFTGFGCGQDKDSKKGSFRGRGASATGSAKPLERAKTEEGTSGPATTLTDEEVKEIDASAATTTPKHCTTEALDAVKAETEQDLRNGYSEMVDGENSEYVLTEVVYHFIENNGGKFPGQFIIKSTGFVDEKSASARNEADKKIEVICENSVSETKTPLVVPGDAKLINRFSTKDGSYISLRKISAYFAGGKTMKVSNEFVPVANTVTNVEKSASALAEDIGSEGTLAKGSDGFLYWRVTHEPKDSSKKYSIVAKYEKRAATN